MNLEDFKFKHGDLVRHLSVPVADEIPGYASKAITHRMVVTVLEENVCPAGVVQRVYACAWLTPTGERALQRFNECELAAFVPPVRETT